MSQLNKIIEIKVLILEDNEDDVGLIEYQLTKLSFATRIKIVDEEEAYLNLLENFEPDIVLSDYSLPGYSGLQAYQAFQQICSDKHFMFITGAISKELANETIVGNVQYILKDDLSELPKKINALFKSNQYYNDNKANRLKKSLSQTIKELDSLKASLSDKQSPIKKTENQISDTLKQLKEIDEVLKQYKEDNKSKEKGE